VAGLQDLPNQLAEFQREANTRFEQIDARLDQIDGRLDGHDSRFDRLEARITGESGRLYARMRMLHEDLVERIKTIGERRRNLRPRTRL